MAAGLPPPPTRAPSGDFAWTSWYNQLYSLLSTSGSVAWSLVNKAGSSIADLQNKAHDLLTGLQGGTAGEHYHMTAAEHATIVANDTKYGAFHNSLSMTATAANTAYAMTLDTNDYTNQVSIVSNSRITVTNAGLYNVQFSVQLTNTDSQEHDVSIWLRKNGTDVAYTNTLLVVPKARSGTDGHTFGAWNFFIQLSASDYVELMWCTDSTSVFIEATSPLSTPTRPATPSLIVTVDRVHA